MCPLCKHPANKPYVVRRPRSVDVTNDADAIEAAGNAVGDIAGNAEGDNQNVVVAAAVAIEAADDPSTAVVIAAEAAAAIV